MSIIDSIHDRSGIDKRLIRAVIKQLGYSTAKKDREELLSTLRDIRNHGADAGYGGFTYYSDTCKFFRRNRASIVELLKSQASDFGHKTITEMVKQFRCAQDSDEDEIGRALFGKTRSDEVSVENCLAWYALEEVARGAEEIDE